MIIKQCLLHFKTIVKHKYYVFLACRDFGIFWRGIKHDLSKFSPTEFIVSAMHFQGNRSPIDKEKEVKGYSLAWQHHKGCNRHHWQYWLDINSNGRMYPLEMPFEDILELVCDWIGAGRAYNKEKWTKEEPYNYWLKNKRKIILHPESERLIEQMLIDIKNRGVKYASNIYSRQKNY